MKLITPQIPPAPPPRVVHAVNFYDNGWPFEGRAVVMDPHLCGHISAEGNLIHRDQIAGHSVTLDFQFPVLAQLDDGTFATCSEIGLNSYLSAWTVAATSRNLRGSQ